MVFNVIKEPCVPVQMKSGEFKTLSIREVFENAVEIRTVSTASHFEEYGIKRLLAVIFMDWIRPKNTKELQEIYSLGRFDMNSFDEYVAMCEEKGDVFNLFSKETPFLQTKYDEKYDVVIDKKGKKTDKIFSINNLFYDIPSNTNHVFFYRDYNEITPADCFRGLTAISLFLPIMGGEGYCSGVNGDSPYYVWINADSLFKEILVNSVTVDSWNDYFNNDDATFSYVIPYAGGIGEEVIWRRNSDVKKKEPFDKISLMEALTFMGRRITLFPNEETGFVDKISITQSSKYVYSDVKQKNNPWRDPFCMSIETGKNATFKPYKPADGHKSWLNLEALYIFNSMNKPLTFEKFSKFTSHDGEMDIRLTRQLSKFGLDTLQVTVYGGYNKGGKGIYQWWSKDCVELNSEIIDNKELSDLYIQALADVKKVAYFIKSNLTPKLDKEYFYNDVKEYIETEFVYSLIHNEDKETVIKQFREKLVEFAVNCYETEFDGFNFNKKVDYKRGKDTVVVDSSEMYYIDLHNLIVNCKKQLGLLESKKKKNKEEK